MIVAVRCCRPGCGKKTNIDDVALGKTIRCRHCGRTFIAVSNDNAIKDTQHKASVTAESVDRATMPSQNASVKRIGRFEIREKLGAGAFGVVFRAYDPQLDRDVALKVPNRGTLESKKAVSRFLREAKAAARLRHPHIVAVYESGQEGEEYYIASEFVAGETLAAASENGRLKFRKVAQLVRELGEALHYAHEQGIVHRDVKPANAMVDPQGKVHLMDFGLAHRHDVSTKLTRDGSVLGTPAYMAPEQARGQHDTPLPASDQYSLGVVLFELLSGQVPFEGRPEVVLFNVIETEPPRPRSIRKNIPLDLETICLKAISKEPHHRYEDCQELADDLRRWLDDEPIRARRLGAVERLTRWARRNRLVAGLAGLAAILCISIATVGLVLSESVRQANEAKFNEAVKRHSAEKERTAQEAVALKAKQQAETAQSEQKCSEQEQHQRELQIAKRDVEREAMELRRQQEELEEARLATIHKNYSEDIRAAFEKWQTGQYANGMALLDSHLAKAGAEDLRGFDWYFIRQLLNKGKRPSLAVRRNLAGITAMAFSPDGQTVVCACEDKSIQFWQLHADAPLYRPSKSDSPISAMTFTGRERLPAAPSQQPDPSAAPTWTLLMGDLQARLSCWSPSTWAISHMASMDGNGKIRIIAAPNDNEKIVVDQNAIMNVYNAHGWKAFRLPVPVGTTPICAVSQNLRIAAFNGPKVTLLDLGTGKSRALNAQKVICALALSDDGTQVAVAQEDNIVKVWSVVSGKQLWVLNGHSRPVHCLDFSDDGKYLSTGGEDKQVRVWELSSGKLAGTQDVGDLCALAFAPNAELLGCGCRDGRLVLWSFRATDETVSAGHPDSTLLRKSPWDAGISDLYGLLAFSPDSRLLAVAFRHEVDVWEPTNGNRLATTIPTESFSQLRGRRFVIRARFSRDGKRLAVVLAGGVPFLEGQVRLSHLAARFTWTSPTGVDSGVNTEIIHFDPSTGLEKGAIPLDTPTLRGLAVSCGSEIVNEKLVNAPIWDSRIDGNSVWGITIAPNGPLYCLTTTKNTIDVHDATTGQLALNLADAFGPVPVPKKIAFGEDPMLFPIGPVAFVDHEKRIVSGGTDGNLRFWNLSNGEKRATIKAHLAAVTSLSVSADGRCLATGSKDGAVKIWDAVTGDFRLQLGEKLTSVTSVAFSPDGLTLAAAFEDGSVRLWRVLGTKSP